MRLEDLEYFVAVADYGSMLKASDMIHVSQQCISRAIKRLEDECNVYLFERTNKGANLTEEGQKAYDIASNVLSHIIELKTLTKNNQNRKLLLGYYIGYKEFIDVLLKILEFKNLGFSYSTMYFSTEFLVREIEEENIDIALGQVELKDYEQAKEYKNYKHMILLKEPVEVLVNAKYFATDDMFYTHNLKSFPVVFYSSSPSEIPLYERIAMQYGVKNVAYKGNDLKYGWKLLKERNAIALFTRSLFQAVKNEKDFWGGQNLKLLPLDESIMIYTILMVKKSIYEFPETQRIVETIEDFFKVL